MRRLGSSLIWKLTIWFLLLSFLPIGVMVVFVRQNVADTFADLAADDTFSQVRLLANEVSASTDERELQTLLADGTNENQFSFIIGEDGVYMAHSDGAKVGGSVFDDFSAKMAKKLVAGGEGVVIEEGTGRFVGFSSVPAAFSTAVLAVDGSVVSAPMLRIERSAFFQLAVSLAIISLAGGVAIWVMFRPIQLLTKAAEEIGAGNLNVQIDPYNMEGELEVLTGAFNNMTKRLREAYEDLERRVTERTRDLATLNTMAQTVSGSLELEAVLTTSLNKVMEASQFESAAIFLKNLETGELQMACYRGLSGAFRTMVAKGIIFARVAKSDNPIIIDNLPDEPDVPKEVIEEGYRAVASIPLISKGQVQGMLTIGSHQLHRFRQEDVELLVSIGHQLGVAIENAQLFQQTRELAVLEERNRMAREIHDTLAQGFTGIVLQLEAAEQALDGTPAEVPDHLSRAKNLARESLQEARRSVWGLLPRALEQHSLEAALQEEVSRINAAGREKTSFSLSGERVELPSNVQAALLRICQESFTNVRRHARATQVTVDLTFYPEAVCLKVQDDGIGFDFEGVKAAGTQSSFGLAGMKERARLLGGTLAVSSQKGKGTLVEVSIPTT